MNDLESAIETEKGLYIVERKFKVMHYESKWPPYQQRESTTPDDKKCRFMSDLLNRKIIRGLREEITTQTFGDMNSIKDYVLDYVEPKVTQEDFGDMANVSPEVTFRVGRGKKFYEYTFQWQNPEDKSINDPWFSIRMTKRG